MALRTAPPSVEPVAAVPRWAAAWQFVPPLVLAALGGWLVAHRYGFWFDELYTAEVAPLPLGRLFDALISGDGTIAYLRDAPPSYNAPYYAVAHLWLTLTPFGADELGLRMLSLLAGTGAVAVFTRAVARLADRRTGLIAGLVLATNPFVVAYAGEARGYTLALLATALAALGLARWLDGEPNALLLYGLAAGAAGLFHWFALLVPAAFALSAVILRRRQSVPVVAVTALAAVPALAVVGIALANGVGSSGAEWIRGVGWIVPGILLRSWSGGHVALLVATAAAVAAGSRATNRQARVVGVCWVAVPVTAVTAAELVRPVYIDRYLLPAVIGLAVLAALGVARSPRRWLPLAVAALLVPSTVATVSNIGKGPREDVRGAVALIAAAHRPGEPVVAAARWDALGLDHYTRRDHPELVADIVLPPAAVPAASSVWVLRRATTGVKGDDDKLAGLDLDLTGRGLRVVDERRVEGRRSVVLVQRWAP
jgi:4-amino-4-deoxy-L-arabinose transferase-like glycosyltransferase